MANVSFGKYEANEQNSVSPGKDYTLNVFLTELEITSQTRKAGLIKEP